MVEGTDPWWVWVWVWAQIPMGIPMQDPNCAYLCYDIIVELGLDYVTSRVAACTAWCTGLDYCRIRCADKILCTIR